MKNTSFVVRCCMVAVLMVSAMGAAQAQNERATLKKAEGLVAQRQYASAFAMLDELDPANDRPAVLAMKADIVLHYFAQSMNHMIFSLVDLKKGESLDSVRINFEMGDAFAFDVDSLSRRLLAAHPGDQSLLSTHAAYHKALLDDYGDDLWMTYLTPECKALLQQATESADACSQMGYLYTSDESTADSAAYYFRRAVALQDTLWEAHYNLGVMEYQLGNNDKALAHLERAWKGYRVPRLKGDAARVMAIIYDQALNNASKAERYYRQAVADDSTDVTSWGFLLDFLLRQQSAQDDVQPVLRSGWHAAVQSDNPFDETGYFISQCMKNEKGSIAIAFLQSRFDEAKEDFELGICHLYLFQLMEKSGEDVAHLRKAIECFEREEAPEDFLNSLRDTLKAAEK
jgi:tetratricopeptide (TPR) repeat protein